ncbi:MAG: alpha-amylase family glycosyl hydrolase, partial [Solobacterium sp.]|nr:alpha-amylase family glycosyl hydrolase [Solobacterium sp.]
MDNNQVFYQIYPLGFCDAPKENDGITVNRIKKVLDWIPHLKKLGITAVYFGPVFESDRHGYDTRDYAKIDCRLGTNEDFAEVADALHDNGIKVVLDGVFNHVGRGFYAFQDVLQHKWDSRYTNWFNINYDNNQNEDGLSYENWEGHPELVKLNLDNPDVRRYLLERVDQWIAEFGIDGLRLDVAYCLNQDFIRDLHHHLKDRDPQFFLLGEMIGGDYNSIMNDDMLDSVTNYECRKGLFSSMNTHNLFEIGYSLNRQF